MDSHTHKAAYRAPRSRNRRMLLLCLSTWIAPSLAQKSTKRGIAFMDTHSSDNSLLQSTNSPISWYYNWSPYPPTSQIPADSPLEFIPLIHGPDVASDRNTANVINSLPSSSRHLLSFNEPDGTTDSGGSSISPEDAAQAYIDHILPYRDSKNRKWNISHPSVTGSPRGLEWLRDFNSSCYSISPSDGCPTDFIAVHWYGAFDGLASWLGTLDEFYNGNRSSSGQPPLKIWITEMALPQADAEATVGMMNQTLPYLDELEYVERYAWFGAFRTNDANEWTGDGVALFDSDGGLTELGALYMGGEVNGFKEGQKGEGLAAALRVQSGLLVGLSMFVVAFSNYW